MRLLRHLLVVGKEERMESINHITGQGETWSSIAWKMYGSMSGIQTLIEANPTVPIDTILPERTIIIVPIKDDTDSSVIFSKLPPWK